MPNSQLKRYLDWKTYLIFNQERPKNSFQMMTEHLAPVCHKIFCNYISFNKNKRKELGFLPKVETKTVIRNCLYHLSYLLIR